VRLFQRSIRGPRRDDRPVCFIPIDPDKREEALDLIEDLVEQSQAEEGMIDYRATTDVNDPNVVRFFEQYEDENAFEAHTQTDHFQEFEAALPDLLAGEPEILRFDVESASELDL
jgi:quinol monooxygenase YgiN